MYLILRILGTVFWVLNLSTNIAYYTYMKFSDGSTYTLYKIFLILRPSLIGALTLSYVVERLILKITKEREANMDGKDQIKAKVRVGPIAQKSFLWLICFPILVFSGFIRLIGQNRQKVPLLVSHSIELIGQCLPLLVLQIYNHQHLGRDITVLQILSFVFTGINILDVLMECII